MLFRVAFSSVLAAAAWAEAPPPATPPSDQPAATTKSSHPHIRFGGFYVSAGYSRFAGVYPFYGFYPGSWYYDPFIFTPIFAPGYYTGFAYQPNQGAVKIQGAEKDAWVYLDGALAGRADKLKQIWLDPGAYTLGLQQGGRTVTRRIYVLSGKTLKVTPDLMEARP